MEEHISKQQVFRKQDAERMMSMESLWMNNICWIIKWAASFAVGSLQRENTFFRFSPSSYPPPSFWCLFSFFSRSDMSSLCQTVYLPLSSVLFSQADWLICFSICFWLFTLTCAAQWCLTTSHLSYIYTLMCLIVQSMSTDIHALAAICAWVLHKWYTYILRLAGFTVASMIYLLSFTSHLDMLSGHVVCYSQLQ